MDDIAIWNVTTGQPLRFQRGKLTAGADLEDWIERDPSLIGDGLVIVGRGVETSAGLIDLLAIDPAGCWIVVAVRNGTLRKEMIAQAKTCATTLHEMDEDALISIIDAYLQPRKTDTQTLLKKHHIDDQTVFDKREVHIVIAGVGHDQPLEPLSKTLTYNDQPIPVHSFDLLKNAAGDQILVRSAAPSAQMDVVKSAPIAEDKEKKKPFPLKHWPMTPAIERLLKIATDNGVGDDFRLIHEAAIRHGLYPRTYRWSIMYAPPKNKSRCLICLWSNREKSAESGAVVYIASEAFAEFYPITDTAVTQILDANHWTRIPLGQAAAFAARMDILFEKISGNYE